MIFENVEQFRAAGFTPRVAVIGAGPAGISVAHKLAKANIPVVVFEAGGAEYSEESQEFYKGKVVGDQYFDLDVSRLRFLGGSSNHWAGWCRVLEEWDFLPKPYVPHTGWPITRAAIDPFLPETFEILGIQPFWPDRMISDEMHQFEVIKSNHVHFGEKFLPEFTANSNIAVVLNTEVSELKGNGRIVTGARLWSNGAPAGEIAVDYFVVATGGLENSRLLLWSNEQSSGGVVPNAAALGRYWMEHPMYTAGAAVITNKDAFVWDEIGDAFVSPTPAAMARRGILNFHIEIETMPYPGMKQYIADLACYAPDMTEWISYQLDLHLQCSARIHVDWEQAPRPDNRIVLSTTDRDPAGVPRLELHWTKDAFDRNTMVEGMRMFGETIAAKDIGRLKISDWVLDGSPYPDGMELAGNHHMGGTRMGDDPAFSVVDANSKVHGMANLYVAGSSVFATSGQCTPTTTITALSLRLGDHLSRIVSA
jgi:choline dehydrogenase-like flavoprotein